MGADRKGPLAAFVVVALIAAVLLITSVRSQAAPWLSTRFVAGPATEPHLWGPVTGGIDDVVVNGFVLARKAAHSSEDDSAPTSIAAASTREVTSRPVVVSTTHHVAQTADPRPAPHHRPRHQQTHRPTHRPQRPAQDDTGSPPGRPGHGRHLGWYRHHGQAEPETDDPTGSVGAVDEGDSDESTGHGHGHGDGHGHGWGHATH